MLVDSHCHLNFPEFRNDYEKVLQNATQAGVNHMLLVNTQLDQAKDLQQMAVRHNNLYCSVGVHPHDVKDHDLETLSGDLKKNLAHPKVVAFGETGLDYYYNHSPKEMQQTSFMTHLEASKLYQVPVIIHTRDADQDTLMCIDKVPGAKGVFHCFSGSLELAKAALDRGYYLSFSGIITFNKATELRDVVKYVPLDCMLVETDSPFLAPVPHRGKRNEPAFTRLVAEKVAELKEISFDEVAEKTTANFFDLFSKAVRSER